jgi:phosphoribosylpyrophosphate synthetase
MDDASARAAVTTAEQGLAEVDAAVAVAEFELAEAPIERLLVTDSIDPPRLTPDALPALEITGCAGLVAEAVRRVLTGGSIPALLGD